LCEKRLLPALAFSLRRSAYLAQVGTFHDLRHTAAPRLAKKLDVWELCKMFSWKDPKMCLNTYYKHDPEETAKKL